jgi:DnaJ-class molecular chaperone
MLILLIKLFKDIISYISMVKDTKLYDILELSPNACESDIEKQYKILARKWHPDKNRGNEELANTKLQEINEAKEILLNPEKRNLYDQFGLDMANGNASAGPNPEDLFNMFGGGMFGNVRREQEQENIVIKQEVTLEQIFNEHSIKIDYKQKVCCERCNGATNKCNICDGKGMRIQIIQMGPMIQQIQSTCGNCRGSGKVVNPNSCSECSGEGWKLRNVSVNVPLKNGLMSGQQIHMQNLGHQLRDSKTDLIVVIEEKEHGIFKRDNINLVINIELKLFQALFGFDKVITHLDNRQLYIHHNGTTNYGVKKKIVGEGMLDLRTKQRGDLIINFTFKLPIITKPDIIQNLQYNLKIVDHEESNKEVEIRVNNSKYIKTTLMDMKEHSEQNNFRQTQNNGGQRFNVEGGPECVQS